MQEQKDFTLTWFKSTWKTMNLMMAIMPTTLLEVLPVGLLLVQNGSIFPAELAMGIILSLSIVGPLRCITVPAVTEVWRRQERHWQMLRLRMA